MMADSLTSSLIETLLAEVTVRCSQVQRNSLTAEEWRLVNYLVPFDSINVLLTGSSSLTIDNETYHLTPGQAIFFREGTLVSRELSPPERTIEVIWIIFNAYSHEHLDLPRLLHLPACLLGATAGRIHQDLQEALREWGSETPARALVINGLLLRMLAAACRAPAEDIALPHTVTPHAATGTAKRGQAQRELVQHAMLFLTEHFAEPLTLERLAASLQVHPSHCCRAFRQLVGVPPMKYLEQVRMGQAERMLLNTALSVQEIAQAVGYPDPYYFSRAFRRVTGQSPSGYRIHVKYIHLHGQ